MITEKVKYVSSFGEVFEFGNNNAWIEESDIHNFAWMFTNAPSRLTDFKRQLRQFNLPICLFGYTEEESLELRDRLTDLTEADVAAEKYGRLYIGDWYLPCNVVASAKSSYLLSERYIRITLTLATVARGWYREAETVTLAHKAVEGGHDYPHDYSFDYSPESPLYISPEYESDFVMRIYGPTLNPSVTIGNKTYGVDLPVADGDFIEIDSVNQTVKYCDAMGNGYSVFGARLKKSYIYSRITAGRKNVTWRGTNKIEIDLYEERSEPRWIN